MSEEADHDTQTCEIRMNGKRLPDLGALSQHISALRLGASLGGVEATVAGELAEESGQLVLRLPETGERLPLAPLRHKIQWDHQKRQPHPTTEREQTALARLTSQRERGPRRFEVVGPLVEENTRVQLEVRSLRPLAGDAR